MELYKVTSFSEYGYEDRSVYCPNLQLAKNRLDDMIRECVKLNQLADNDVFLSKYQNSPIFIMDHKDELADQIVLEVSIAFKKMPDYPNHYGLRFIIMQIEKIVVEDGTGQNYASNQ